MKQKWQHLQSQKTPANSAFYQLLQSSGTLTSESRSTSTPELICTRSHRPSGVDPAIGTDQKRPALRLRALRLPKGIDPAAWKVQALSHKPQRFPHLSREFSGHKRDPPGLHLTQIPPSPSGNSPNPKGPPRQARRWKPNLRSQTRDWGRALLTWAVRSGPAPGAVEGSRRGCGPSGCWRGPGPAGSRPRFPDSADSARAAASRLPASTHVARPGPLAKSIARLGPATPQVAGAGGVGAASGPQALPRCRRACSVRASAESFLGTRHWHLGLGGPAGGRGPSARRREGEREPGEACEKWPLLDLLVLHLGALPKSDLVTPVPRKLRGSKCSSVNAYPVL